MRRTALTFLLLGLVVGLGVACSAHSDGDDAKMSDAMNDPMSDPMGEAKSQAAEAGSAGNAVATFAGGCFWCMEAPFDKLDGVFETISGYTAGHQKNPTYKQVSAGVTGHTEAVRITYDPAKISYAELLDVFWKNIDPEAVDRQFCDRGTQYRSGIYYHDDAQRDAAEATKKTLEESGKFSRVATEVEPAGTFYPAEEYHQDYYLKNPSHYKRYRAGCGRDSRLTELWGASH
jgi:peptide-methionine (S)-S-oxide reductase